MRLSPALCKQHIGWHFKKFFVATGLRKVQQTKAAEILKANGVPVVDPDDILVKKREFVKVDVIGLLPKPVAFDHTHPDWHERPLLTYTDTNVLLEGLNQAKILTKTVQLKEGLPETFELKSTKDIDGRVKEIILNCHVFDAEQKKLPKIKDPQRPAWNFPRIYGISQDRVNKLLLTNLLHLIESTSDWNVVKERYLIDDLLFSYNFERFGSLLQFQLKGDSVLTSSKPLRPVTKESTDELELPDIYPIKPTITLMEENIYKAQTFYPLDLNTVKSHPHTIFIHHNDEDVKNFFEEPVTDPQIHGRSLLKTFTVAASYAKQRFGDDIKNLPIPVTIQCVHTNGKLFHFGILQLNTLDLEEGNRKNIWYQTDRIPLFETCCYSAGKPILEGYNSNVIKYLKAFYNNI